MNRILHLAFVALSALLSTSSSIFCAGSFYVAQTRNSDQKIIAVINLDGQARSWDTLMLLQQQFINPQVKGIILSLDAVPSLGTAYILSQHIQKFKNTYSKPVIAFAEHHLLHASYLIACATDAIVLSEVASVGAIGFWREYADKTAQDKKKGLRYTFYSRGDYKLMGNPHTPLQPQWQRAAAEQLKDQHASLCDALMSLRPSIKQAYSSWAHGQIIPAVDAHAHKLIDVTGGQLAAVRVTCERLGMDKKQLADESYMSTIDIQVIEGLAKKDRHITPSNLVTSKGIDDAE